MIAAAPPALPPPLPFDQRIASFLHARGNPVSQYQRNAIEDPASFGARGGGKALPGKVDYSGFARRAVLAAERRMAARRGAPVNQLQLYGLHVGLHEGLHQMRFGRTPEVAEANLAWEEGATDAVARDLLPLAARRFFGHRMMPTRRREALTPERSYDQEVGNIRAISVALSGARRYEDIAARRKRREMLHADADQRRVLAEQAAALMAGRR